MTCAFHAQGESYNHKTKLTHTGVTFLCIYFPMNIKGQSYFLALCIFVEKVILRLKDVGGIMCAL